MSVLYRNRFDPLKHYHRGREGGTCSRKVKTNMLAAVLILTSIPPGVKLTRGVVEHLVHLISQKLEESDDVSKAPHDPEYPHRLFCRRP